MVVTPAVVTFAKLTEALPACSVTLLPAGVSRFANIAVGVINDSRSRTLIRSFTPINAAGRGMGVSRTLMRSLTPIIADGSSIGASLTVILSATLIVAGT